MKYIILSLSIVISSIVTAQIRKKTISLDQRYLYNKDNVPVITMPSLDIDRISKEDEVEEGRGALPHFGYPIAVGINLFNSGVWQELPDGNGIWQLRIRSSGAQSINLLYDAFWLPKGGELYLEKANGRERVGAFTSRNNKGTQQDLRGFATCLLKGDEIKLIYLEPEHARGESVVSVSHVVHGYKTEKMMSKSKSGVSPCTGFGCSGSCQVNINCGEGDDWQREKTGVVRIIVDGSRYCTGSLINNTSNDGTPYVLTANHCMGTTYDALGNTDLSQCLFQWGYESPVCDYAYEVHPLTTVGATLIANGAPSDFALLELTENPVEVIPHVYFNGWDRRNSQGAGGVGIHHPRGDIKKIATYSVLPYYYIPYQNHWAVNWDATPNGFSVTEGGSSGSPLFNNQKRIIGQLEFSVGTDCNNPSGEVSGYGKIYRSWDDWIPERRLKDWLDPINSGAMSINGYSGCGYTQLYNQSYTSAISVQDCKIDVKNVTVSNGSNTVLDAETEVLIKGPFEVSPGSTFEAK